MVDFSVSFFFSPIFISWGLITLQYCSGFAIHWHESAVGLHVFPVPISVSFCYAISFALCALRLHCCHVHKVYDCYILLYNYTVFFISMNVFCFVTFYLPQKLLFLFCFYFISLFLAFLSCLYSVQFSSVQSLSLVWLFVTPWTTARQASLSITNSWSPPKPTSVKWVMPSNRLIFCRPLLLLPPILPIIRVFSNESALCMRWPKYWSFSFSISPYNEHPGLISFRMDWFIVYITVSLVVRAISLD